MAALAEDICESWGWMGIASATVVAANKFGNIIFTDQAGKYWRIYHRTAAITISELLRFIEFKVVD